MSQNSPKIRTLIADDHEIVRQGLRTLLENENCEVVAEFSGGRDAVEGAKKLKPDVAVLDISMPDLNGIEAARQITTETGRVKVLTLSMHSDGRFVKQVFTAGASGYLLKECAFDELVNAIHTVMAGQIYLSPRVTHAVLAEYLGKDQIAQTSVFSVLTAREREVLQLMAEGKTTKEIAYSLGLSIKTVEAHRQKIMEKSNIHSIAELTRYAIREGITSLEP